MLYIFIGFAFGFCIPYMARRFAKFMPANLPYALYRIFAINKTVSFKKRKASHKYQLLSKKYFMRSLGWGITTSAIIFLGKTILSSTEIPWLSCYVMISLLLMEIDKRIQYLPDILTVPLLILGFSYATFAGGLLGENPVEAMQNSCLGAIWGMCIPTIAALCLVKKHPNAFGGGDIKLLSATGSWFGVVNIPFILLLSCLIFAVSCYINKQRSGAFGPSIVISSLIILFYLEY